MDGVWDTHFNKFLEKAKGDHEYGGDFLYSTYCECESSKNFREVLNSEKGPTDWKALSFEVFRQYWWERQIMEHKLEIGEHRPRTFFSVSPGRKVPLEPETDECPVECYEIGPPKSASAPKKPRLSVLLPISNGYRKTYRSLACLCYDVEELIDRFFVQFHICVNFSDDNSLNEVNRFAKTMAYSHGIPIVLYSAENPERMGRQGSEKRWWKTTVLNTMIRNIVSENKETLNCCLEKYYLHFADDDIFIKPGTNVIQNNIEVLKNNPTLNLISASYSNDEDWGFSAINAVGKRPEYVESEGFLLNIYGGCMTTTLKRFGEVLDTEPDTPPKIPTDKRLGQEFGEDSYLTIKANINFLRNKSADQSINREELKAYATRKIVVGHPEPTNIVSFAKRYARDRKWGKASALMCAEKHGNLDGQELHALFQKLRRNTFQDIYTRIQNGKEFRHILAQQWAHEIRDKIRDGIKEDRNPWENMKGLDWVKHKTRHQICSDIVENRRIFDAITEQISGGPFGYDLVQCMRESAANPAERFPEICRLLAVIERDSIIESFLQKNSYLFHLYTIAEEALAYEFQFMEKIIPESDRTQVQNYYEARGLSERKLEEFKIRFPLDFNRILTKALGNKIQDPSYLPENTTRELSSFYFKNSTRSLRSYTVFLSNKRNGNVEENLQKLFLRYYTVVGRSKFLKDSPRRTVYLHVLGEKVVKTILDIAKGNKRNKLQGDSKGKPSDCPDLKIVSTLYPKLKEAMLNYAGPEQRSSFGRLMQSLYIQKSLQGKVKQLSSVVLGDEQYVRLSRCMGEFLGKLHGITLGVRPRLHELNNAADNPILGKILNEVLDKNSQCRSILQLLIEHLDKIRLFLPKDYKKWLEDGADRPGSISFLLDRVQKGGTGVGLSVESLIRQDGWSLYEIWQDLCHTSEKAHEKYGTVAHLGLYASNLFVSWGADSWGRVELRGRDIRIASNKARIQSVYLANHAGIAMADPAVEAGRMLAELISARLSSSVMSRSPEVSVKWDFPRLNDKSLPDIMNAFLDEYRKTFQETSQGFRDSDSPISAEISQDLLIRLCRFAAIFLLAEYHNKREYDLIDDDLTDGEGGERKKLTHVCVDLLHKGTYFRLLFR